MEKTKRKSRKSQILFLVLSVAFMVLVFIAAAEDANNRPYIAIQEQYQKTYKEEGSFTIGVQQLDPTFAEAQSGPAAFSTYKEERCISCHVPDIATITPNQAAQRISQQFYTYAPNAQQLAKEYDLTGTHPAYVTAQLCDTYGSSAVATADGFHSYEADLSGTEKTANLPGFIPSFLCQEVQQTGQPLSIADVGCIVCHNGNRLALTESNAHQNLIVNPEYSWTEGASIYYEYCVSCHGIQGGGDIGPPLDSQDRLGFFNEDYYYRCIEYGFSGFEHYGSVMPAWGSIASNFNYTPSRDNPVALSPAVIDDYINDWLKDNGGKPVPYTQAFENTTTITQTSNQALLTYVSQVSGVNFTSQDLNAAIGDNHPRVLSEQQITTMTQFIRQWEQYQTLP